MPRRGRKRKKTRTHVVDTDERIRGGLLSNDELKIPRSLVIRRGKVESELTELVTDIRKLMRPYTAVNFKEDAKNRKVTLSHYANSLSTSMGVTHILAVTQNSNRVTLRVGRTPGGPTLSFRVKRFTLGRQIRAVQRRPYDSTKAFESPPVVVTNNFGDVSAAPHVKLMRITFQNMFPAINVSTVKLSECRRVVLFNFIRRDMSQVSSDKKKHVGDDDDLEDEEVEIRHYAIRAKPVGVDRKVRRLVEAKIPNLSKLSDISDYITGQTSSGAPAPAVLRPGEMSDSEPEDEDTQVVLPGKYRGKGNNQAQKSALKLVELGPRLRIKLYKVERGMASGDVMYHAYENKTPEEVKALKQRKEGEAALKKRRREEQEANVARKQAAKDKKLAAKKARKKEREEKAMAALRGEVPNDDGADQEESSSEEEEEEEGTDSESFEEESGDEDDSEAGMESSEED
jgi:ribosome biogenesis protein SSF1/2